MEIRLNPASWSRVTSSTRSLRNAKEGTPRSVASFRAVVVVIPLTVQACMSVPTSPDAATRSTPGCRPAVYVARTTYRKGTSGEVSWTIIFDSATREALASQTRTDDDGREHVILTNLDCLIDAIVKAVCSRGWRHDPQIAVDREDGTLQADGLCN